MASLLRRKIKMIYVKRREKRNEKFIKKKRRRKNRRYQKIINEMDYPSINMKKNEFLHWFYL